MRSRLLAVRRTRLVVPLLCLSAALLTPAPRLAAQSAPATPPAVVSAPAPHVDTLLATVPSVTQLHYVVRGTTGPTVIFVHGTFGELGDWEPQLAALAPRYRVVSYSRRFHPPNAPPAPSDHYVMDQHAEDLATLIRDLHAAPVHLVAHSYGAYVALRLTLMHPELVRSLVLAEPPVLGFLPGTPAGDSVAAAFRANALDPSRAAFVRGDSVDGMRRFMEGVVGRPGSYDAMPEAVRVGLLRAAGELRAEMTTPMAEYMTPVSCEQVHRIKQPVLLTTGERSARLFHLINARLQGCLAAPDTVTIPGKSHGSQVSAPVFIDRVEAFLAAH